MRGLFFILLTLNALSAQTVQITGTYLDLMDNPIDSAMVTYSADNIAVDSTMTDASGNFSLHFSYVSIDPILPSGFHLGQNYPNPFNPSTRIELSITAPARFTIYDIRGALIQHVELDQAGNYELTWGGRNLPAGLYLYVLQSVSQSLTRKMILLDGGEGSGLNVTSLSQMQDSRLARIQSEGTLSILKNNTTPFELNLNSPLADTSLGILNGNVGPRQVQTIPDTVMYEGDTLQVDWDNYFYNDSETYYPPQFIEYMYLTDTTFYEVEVVAIDVVDTNLVVISNTYSVTWLPVNDAPILQGSPSDTTMMEDDTLTILASQYFNDEDSELEYFIQGLTNAIWWVEEDSQLMIAAASNWFGTLAELTLMATDGEYETSSNSFSVIVEPVNDPPQFLNTFSDTSIYKENLFTLPVIIEDMDTDSIQMGITLADSLWVVDQDTLHIITPNTGVFIVEMWAWDGVDTAWANPFQLTVMPWPEWKHITGTVRDIYSLEGMEGLTVQLLDSATIIFDFYTPFDPKNITELDPDLVNILEEVQTDIDGNFHFPTALPGHYVLNVLPMDTSQHFSKKGMILEVHPRSSMIDSVCNYNDYVMIPRVLSVPNSNDENIFVDLLTLIEGKDGLVDFDILLRNYQQNAFVNVHEMYQRPIELYLGGFSAEDSSDLMNTIALGDSIFGSKNFVFGRQEPWVNGFPVDEFNIPPEGAERYQILDSLRRAYDPVTNPYSHLFGWNIYEYYSRPTQFSSSGNHQTWSSRIYHPNTYYAPGGTIINVGMGSIAMLKELYARLPQWGDVPSWRRSSLMNLAAHEPSNLDRALDNIHTLHKRRVAEGYESGNMSDYRLE